MQFLETPDLGHSIDIKMKSRVGQKYVKSPPPPTIGTQGILINNLAHCYLPFPPIYVYLAQPNRQRMQAFDDPEAAYRNFMARQPAGRCGTPEEVAAAAAYLASDEVQLSFTWIKI